MKNKSLLFSRKTTNDSNEVFSRSAKTFGFKICRCNKMWRYYIRYYIPSSPVTWILALNVFSHTVLVNCRETKITVPKIKLSLVNFLCFSGSLSISLISMTIENCSHQNQHVLMSCFVFPILLLFYSFILFVYSLLL